MATHEAQSYPEAAWAAALAELDGVPASRLVAMLHRDPPSVVYADLMEQRVVIPRAADVGERWDRCLEGEMGVTWIGHDRYPPSLVDDVSPPAVLFYRGDLELLDGRRAAVVGTRNATAAGRNAAFGFGADLAASGVHVISGLARGIDACAHRGALSNAGASGRPIGVVGSGLDVVYPREHAALWGQVAETGVLLSEFPPESAPLPYHFPMRNRIVAALAEALVVVESRHRGGSLITVDEALLRSVPVLAVPGGIHNRSADGTNGLLRDGAAVAIDASDVLALMAIDHRRLTPRGDPRQRPDPADLAVYEACCALPRTMEGITLHTGQSLVQVAMSLARLDQLGWVTDTDGWYEAIGAPLR